MGRVYLVKDYGVDLIPGVVHKQSGANSPAIVIAEEGYPEAYAPYPEVCENITDLWARFPLEMDKPEIRPQESILPTITSDPGSYLVPDVTKLVGSVVLKEAWNQLSKTHHYVLGSSANGRVLVTYSISSVKEEVRYHFLDTGCKWYSLDSAEEEEELVLSLTKYDTRTFVYGVTEMQLITKIKEYVSADIASTDVPRWIKKLTSCIPMALLDIWPTEPLDAAYNMVDEYFLI